MIDARNIIHYTCEKTIPANRSIRVSPKDREMHTDTDTTPQYRSCEKDHGVKFFSKVLKLLHDFRLDEPFALESEIEKRLAKFLTDRNILHGTQRSTKTKRYDVVCYDGKSTICIEIKIKAESSNLRQFDRYLPDADGFIVLCWMATKPVREIFRDVKAQSPIPVALIELSKKHSII